MKSGLLLIKRKIIFYTANLPPLKLSSLSTPDTPKVGLNSIIIAGISNKSHNKAKNMARDPKNPTLEWLSIQNVNSLTQKYGYTLKFITMTNENDEQYTQYHLTRSKTDRNDGKFIVVTCTYRGITLGHHCFLP